MPALLAELINVFPVLQELTLHCHSSDFVVYNILARCTFPLLWYFAVQPYGSWVPEWTETAFDLLPCFLERHCTTLTSLVLPTWRAPCIDGLASKLRTLNATFTNSRICTLHVSFELGPPTTWNHTTIPSLHELYLSSNGYTVRSTAIWPNAPNLCVLIVTLAHRDRINMKTVATSYPLLRELYLDANDDVS